MFQKGPANVTSGTSSGSEVSTEEEEATALKPIIRLAAATKYTVKG
jgi:hypothetical protein